jgi:hypothetical protein
MPHDGHPMRETPAAKAHRYLSHGRLTVTHLTDHHIEATCHGDTGTYQLGWNPPDGWWCDCPATTRRCAHLTGLRLVTVVEAQRVSSSDSDAVGGGRLELGGQAATGPSPRPLGVRPGLAFRACGETRSSWSA